MSAQDDATAVNPGRCHVPRALPAVAVGTAPSSSRLMIIRLGPSWPLGQERERVDGPDHSCAGLAARRPARPRDVGVGFRTPSSGYRYLWFQASGSVGLKGAVKA
jgi:hypothetical protein